MHDETGIHEETRLRMVALQEAVKFTAYAPGENNRGAVLSLAQAMFTWLSTRTVKTLTLDADPPVEQQKEIPMQIHDNEQYTLSAKATDAKGFQVSDNLTWTVDNPNVVSLQVSDDTMECTVVAGTPGSAVITVTDGNKTKTEAVDVVSAGADTINLTEGSVTAQGASTAPAGGAGTTTAPAPTGTDAGTPAPAPATTDAGTGAPTTGTTTTTDASGNTTTAPATGAQQVAPEGIAGDSAV